jgi:hypothetical protein
MAFAIGDGASGPHLLATNEQKVRGRGRSLDDPSHQATRPGRRLVRRVRSANWRCSGARQPWRLSVDGSDRAACIVLGLCPSSSRWSPGPCWSMIPATHWTRLSELLCTRINNPRRSARTTPVFGDMQDPVIQPSTAPDILLTGAPLPGRRSPNYIGSPHTCAAPSWARRSDHAARGRTRV